MAGTVVGVFQFKSRAVRAAEALLAADVPIADITLVSQDAGGQTGAPALEGNAPARKQEEFLTHTFREVPIHDVEQPISPVEEVMPRVTTGIVIGLTLGALLVSTAVLVPAIASAIATGPMKAMLLGGIGGGVIGAIIAALSCGGIPKENAQAYHDHVTKGDTLVTVLSSAERAPHVEEILRQNGGAETNFFTRFLDTVQSIES